MTKYLAAAIVALLLLLGLSGWALKASYAANGVLKADVRDRDEVIEQKEKDASLSAKIIGQQQVAMAELNTKAQNALTQVNRAPITTACAASPAMRAANRGVHDIITSPGSPDPGRQPAPAVRGPSAGK